mgnify:CR=1 FL=1
MIRTQFSNAIELGHGFLQPRELPLEGSLEIMDVADGRFLIFFSAKKELEQAFEANLVPFRRRLQPIGQLGAARQRNAVVNFAAPSLLPGFAFQLCVSYTRV